MPYGGVLDSPVVFVHHPALDQAPISPPRTAELAPLGLPLDTPSAEQPSHWSSYHDSSDMRFDTGYATHPHYEPFRPNDNPWMDVDSGSEATDSEVEMLVDEDEPFDYTASPLYSPPPELDEDDGFSPTSPLSPSFDDFTDLAPCSPSLRLTTSLPDFDKASSHLFSCHSLFSLPGADVDDDLIPSDLGLSRFVDSDSHETSSNCSGASNLLLGQSTIHSIPTPTTPPQDQLDIDVDRLDEVTDLRRLAILRKKSQEMETKLKDMEEQMLQLGEVQARADVRRERKRFKERSREITAMLKLIVGDNIFSRPEGSNLPAVPMGKKTIATMDHLVSRMLFKRRERNELPRPIATAHRSPLEKTYVPSKLSRSHLSEHVTARDWD